MVKRKKYTKFRPTVLTRHPSHEPLRRKYQKLPLMPFRAVIRLGSTTEVDDDVTHGGNRVELNSVKSVQNSSNKKTMKDLFTKAGVTTPMWQYLDNVSSTTKEGVIFVDNVMSPLEKMDNPKIIPFPVVVKKDYGSRGRGNTKIDTKEDFDKFVKNLQAKQRFIVERFHNFTREYRIHVNKNGGFYFLRKMLKSDTPEADRWFRNDSNSVWILDTNENFQKPVNMKEIENESVKALKAVGLDFGAVDVRVQGATTSKGKKRDNPLFTIIEINSAPSFGDITLEKYIEQIPKMLTEKSNA